MKAVSAAFAQLLDSGVPLVAADLYTLTLADGTTLNWTGAQRPLTVGGVAYAVGPVISRDRLSSKIGLGVDQIHVTLADAGVTTINGVPLAAAARRGMFDGAKLEIRRWLSAAWEQVGAPPTISIDTTADWAAGTLDDVEAGNGVLQIIRQGPRVTGAGDTRVTGAGDIRYTA